MPENTLPAYQWALKNGATVLETDVRLSRDGTLFMFHDESLARITDGRGAVIEASDQQLRQVTVCHPETTGAKQPAAHQSVPLITLEELFDALPDTPINIDIKDNLTAAADEVVRLIEHYDRDVLTTVGSFHASVILHLRKRNPTIRTAALKGEAARLYFGRLVGLKAPDIDYVALQIPVRYKGLPLATRSFVNYCRQLGLEMVYWTVNEPEMLRHLQAIGVDGVVTDHADIARAVFDGVH